jgi:4-hydroxy-tetrahydrodipicolinate reductase
VNCVIFGAAGRMGLRLSAMVHADEVLRLHAAVDRAGSPHLGSDVGELAGVGKVGVPVTADRVAALRGAQVAIDFTEPSASVQNALAAAAARVPVVVATTGQTPEEREQIREAATRVPVVFSPNMSIGVNLLFAILPEIARTLGEEYDIEVIEAHHRMKKDAPSGTALRLAEVLAGARGWKLEDVGRTERRGNIGERPRREIGLQTVRGGDIVGEHTVIFAGIGERVEVTHRASSRDTFARGAVRAARWLPGKPPGLYDMLDVLGLGRKP